MPQTADWCRPHNRERVRQAKAYGGTYKYSTDQTLIEKISAKFEQVASRQLRSYRSVEYELRAYAAPLSDVFRLAVQDNVHISINDNVMGGAPCIMNTRIPVWMVVEAVEEHGGIIDAIEKSYPHINEDQVRAALRFAKTVVECPLEYKTGIAY